MTIEQIESGLMFPIMYTGQSSYDLRFIHGRGGRLGLLKEGAGIWGRSHLLETVGVVLFHFFFSFLRLCDCRLVVAGQLCLYLLEADVHNNL